MNSIRNKYLKFFAEIGPLFVALAIQPFIHGELALIIVVIALLIISWLIKYHQGEWILFLLGVLIGFFFEAMGGQVYRLQYWQNASFLGIPIWLPLLWGYGFIFVNRLGKLCVK